MTEGTLASAVWRACLDAGHPITVAASRHAAAEALALLEPPPPLHRWPKLMADLHETRPPWHNPGLLAAHLRRHADRLDVANHRAMLADAERAISDPHAA